MSSKNGAFRVGLVQMSCTLNPAENREKAADRVRQAARRGAQVICLQELFASQYFCQEEDWKRHGLAETIPGPSTDLMSKLARETKTAIVVPVFEHRARGVNHNSAAVIDADGTMLGVYRKMHIPDDKHYYEKYYFVPGDLGYKTFQTKFARIGVLICWDQWYPEAARITALQGADILFYPTAIGWHPSEKKREGAVQRDAWMTVQRGHAVANGIYVAAANRVGHEKAYADHGRGIEFWGSSFVCGPQGELLGKASTGREQILITECDPRRIEEVRHNWPFLRDRQIESYAPITRRWID
jgi:N-carbamoylputrescine amidase